MSSQDTLYIDNHLQEAYDIAQIFLISSQLKIIDQDTSYINIAI